MERSWTLELAMRLRQRRLDLGWSRRLLAERASVAESTLKHFERTGDIALSRLVRLATVLRVDDGLQALFARAVPRTLDDIERRAKRRQRGRSQ